MILLASISSVSRGIAVAIPDQDRKAFNGAGSSGCGLFLLYRWNAQRTEVIVIEADQSGLRVDRGSKTFNLANVEEGLRVHLDVYDKAQANLDYCSDLKRPLSENQPAVWLAQSGRITIEVNGRSGLRQATARLEDAVFRKPDGALVRLTGSTVIRATVGMFVP
jgi:hypothetical protein